MNPLMLQPGRAPGRATPGDQPATPAPKSGTETTSTSADGPASTAAADSAPPGGLLGGMGPMLILPLLLFGLIILMNRSDKKRRQEIESKLKKGDRIVTRAGIMGKVVEVADGHARVEIAPGVVVKMLKTAIEGLADEDSAKSSKKDSGKDADSKAAKDGKKKK